MLRPFIVKLSVLGVHFPLLNSFIINDGYINLIKSIKTVGAANI